MSEPKPIYTDNKITLKYRPEAMTLNDMCVLEMPPSFIKIRQLLAKHFVDAQGNYVEDIEAAELAIGNISKSGIAELIAGLWQQINEYSEKSIDPN